MEVAEQIEKFRDILEANYKKEIHEIVTSSKKSLVMDFMLIAEFEPELSELILSQPEDLIKAAEQALSEMDIGNKDIRIRVCNLPLTQRILIRNVRSEHIDKFITFDGIIRQSSDVRPQVVSARFECPSCGNTISIIQLDTKFKEPSRCSCGRRGSFRLLKKDLVDAQRLVIEESPESLDGGEQPKRLPVFLKEDLVEPKMEKRTTPGSKVRVVGTIKEQAVMLTGGIPSVRLDLYADVNFIEPIEKTFEEFEVSLEDEKEIHELAKDPLTYERLVRSIAPSIYGHDGIKEALLLQLMGGVKKERPDGNITRGDMHILLVGDPGAAKSSLLMFISKIAPKARYVSGKGTSAAGITATVVKDEFLRGFALEAGALVLANGGFLMLDEMDKMAAEDTSALHEAMAQQRISISKANIQATLKAETTILAAANPKFGRFDPYQVIASQINLPPALINRFDLIFPVRDLPNKELDSKIASHVLRLQKNPEEAKSEIPTALIKKYISYARQKIKPVLTEEAINEIHSFYVALRNSVSGGDAGVRPIPISARQLEALVRLAEANAKIRLDKEVRLEDAKKAIALLKKCLMEVGMDKETGQIDIDIISTGISSRQRNKIWIIRDIIEELGKQFEEGVPFNEIIESAKEKNINEKDVDEVITKLEREGDLFHPKPNFYAITKRPS